MLMNLVVREIRVMDKIIYIHTYIHTHEPLVAALGSLLAHKTLLIIKAYLDVPGDVLRVG